MIQSCINKKLNKVVTQYSFKRMYIRCGSRFIWSLQCNLQDLLCFPSLFIPLSILHFWWSVMVVVRLVPWNNDAGDEILGKLLSHNHIGCLWLTLLSLGTFLKWDYLLIRIWKAVLLGDSVLWVVLPPIIAGFCLILTAPQFYWQRDPVWVPL
jgi:hypothetical protein